MASAGPQNGPWAMAVKPMAGSSACYLCFKCGADCSVQWTVWPASSLIVLRRIKMVWSVATKARTMGLSIVGSVFISRAQNATEMPQACIAVSIGIHWALWHAWTPHHRTQECCPAHEVFTPGALLNPLDRSVTSQDVAGTSCLEQGGLRIRTPTLEYRLSRTWQGTNAEHFHLAGSTHKLNEFTSNRA